MWVGTDITLTHSPAARSRCDMSNCDDLEEACKTWWPALLDLFQVPYWRRLWIIQEVVLARKLRIYYGVRWISWGALMVALERILKD
jgi:hypothetical protein